MIGLGDPNLNRQEGITQNNFDKLQELENRIIKLEKTLGWLKWVVIFMGILMLTSKSKNEN